MKENKKLKVLDLGCGILPESLLKIYHKYDYGNLQGVEIEDKGKTYLYYKLGSYKLLNGTILRPELSEKELESFVEANVKYNTNISDFFKDNNETYNLVIAQKSLHFLKGKPRFKEAIKSIKSRLAERGKYWIQINPNFKGFNSMKLEEYYEELHFYLPYSNTIELFIGILQLFPIYVGIRK